MKNMTVTFMKKNLKLLFTVGMAFVVALSLTGCAPKDEPEDVAADYSQSEIELSDDDQSAETANVDIPQDIDTDKMVSVSVENLGRANPFMPVGEVPGGQLSTSVPTEKLKYDLLEPLETPAADPVAQKVVTTKVSGIMYDNVNPSAILNIDGSDYLVRSGDVINGYKVLSITKSVVTVQMGSNVYKAGVGQLVADGKASVNYNSVANLSSKFGGAKK